jgi:MraZ protein
METEPLPQSPPPEQPPPSIRYGNFATSIDAKRRLVRPAEVRYGMEPVRDGRSFYLFIGKNRKIWFYPRQQYIQLISKVRLGLIPSDEDMDFYQATVGRSFELEWDKQGRVIVPEPLLRRAKILKLPAEVTIVGTVEHYQLWPSAEWEANSDRLDTKFEPIMSRAKENGLTV